MHRFTRPLVCASMGLAIVSLALPLQALAQADLFNSKNCSLCHAVDKQVIGPAFQSVAAKYRGDKEAKDRLAAKIVSGGAGVWGKIAMPANPQVNAEEAKSLAEWVLSQK